MAHEDPIRRYKTVYAALLRLYPEPYRERFAEPMEQAFGDVLRERKNAGSGLTTVFAWMFLETLAGIIKENTAVMIMQRTTKRLTIWFFIVVLILLVPLVAMQFTGEVNWDLSDFVIMGGALFGVGIAYELVARKTAGRLKSGNTPYRVAFGVGLLTAFLLFWVNGAVGMIGNENQPANLLYVAVFTVGFAGSLVARFKPGGMARTLFGTAVVQVSIPVIAVIVWPGISWGEAGIVGVFVLNAFFAALFAVSGLLFRSATKAMVLPK